MKTSTTLRAATLSSVAFFATALFNVSAHAGPGAQYWQAKASDAPAKVAANSGVCPSSEVVAVAVQKPAQPNGRGPLVAAEQGTERICRVCPVTTTETTNAWSNHRGPLTTKEVTKTGVPHVCTSGCAMAKS